MNKPEILSDERIQELIDVDVDSILTPLQVVRVAVEVQRDADAAHYEPLLKQARREVAAEIFEEIENREFISLSTHRFSEAEARWVKCGWYADLKVKYLK